MWMIHPAILHDDARQPPLGGCMAIQSTDFHPLERGHWRHLGWIDLQPDQSWSDDGRLRSLVRGAVKRLPSRTGLSLLAVEFMSTAGRDAEKND
jgi:hypothetical protein